jgi:hypothetical protein
MIWNDFNLNYVYWREFMGINGENEHKSVKNEQKMGKTEHKSV